MALNVSISLESSAAVVFGEQKPIASSLRIELLISVVCGGLALFILPSTASPTVIGTQVSPSPAFATLFLHPPSEVKFVICVLLAMTAYTLAQLAIAAVRLRQEEKDLHRCRKIVARFSAHTFTKIETTLTRMLSRSQRKRYWFEPSRRYGMSIA